jgi:hypothetical protein
MVAGCCPGRDVCGDLFLARYQNVQAIYTCLNKKRGRIALVKGDVVSPMADWR